MVKFVKRRWIDHFSVPLRSNRRSCEHKACTPDCVFTRRFGPDGDVAAEVTDAEESIARLPAFGAGLVNSEAIARILLYA